MSIREGQWEDYYDYEPSPSPMFSQQFVPSSQSQVDGIFDSSTTLGDHPDPPTPRHTSLFLVPLLPGNRLPDNPSNDDCGSQSHARDMSTFTKLPRLNLNSVETSLIEIDDGHEYVLSSQSQLVLPLHASPRKSRTRTSYPSWPSLSDDPILSDEIVPSSQSQIEKELGESNETSDNRSPHGKTELEAAEAGAVLISKRYPNIKAIAIKADVSKEDEVKNAVDTAVKEFGRLDVMVRSLALSLARYCSSFA
ncbi:hypothetical protein H0H87_011757 [Tephrocybe sp. NHM501043]|nr:hypothetical protein H0H87_011757 [Tephrocybe sp. NHM501043]